MRSVSTFLIYELDIRVDNCRNKNECFYKEEKEPNSIIVFSINEAATWLWIVKYVKMASESIWKSSLAPGVELVLARMTTVCAVSIPALFKSAHNRLDP